jgi:hypothetical protein
MIWDLVEKRFCDLSQCSEFFLQSLRNRSSCPVEDMILGGGSDIIAVASAIN